MGLKRWRRGQGGQLSPHFKAKEFECSCGLCSEQMLESELLDLLEAVRTDVGPVRVTSGFRCARKQQQLREAGFETVTGVSSHEQGKAADISAPNMLELEKACLKHFHARSVGVANSFIHVDVRAGGPRRWGYARV